MASEGAAEMPIDVVGNEAVEALSRAALGT